jgi:hypothetical protein
MDACNEESLKNRDCGGDDFCECTHIIEADLGDVVEIWCQSDPCTLIALAVGRACGQFLKGG